MAEPNANADPGSANQESDPGNNDAGDEGSYIGDPVAFVRTGRGRHKRDCPCDKCAAKRTGDIGGTGSGSGKSATAKTGTQKATKGLDLEFFAGQIEGLHRMAAMVLKAPALIIQADEAKLLAVALKNLSQHYNIVPNPAVMAWVQLVTVAASVYGPRLMIMRMQASAAKARGPIPPNITAGAMTGNGIHPAPAPENNGIVPQAQTGVYKFQ